MNHQEYVESANRASQLVERGDHKGAIEVLQTLVAADISDIDKAMMCLNLAIVYDKLDDETEALAWYEKGIEYEKPHGRYYVAESHAAYLAQKARYTESYKQYQDLLDHPGLTEFDQERVKRNLQALLKQI